MDWTQLRRRVALLESLAEQVRDAAHRTVVTAGVEWRSLAAGRFREALLREAAGIRCCAALIDGAASELAVHARAVEAHSPGSSR